MRRQFQQVATALAILFAAAQLIRPERANPATDPRQTIAAHMSTTPGLLAVLDRSCRDCHSNQTVWPSYTQVAPLSWLMAYGVRHGRNALNFSEWAAYAPDRQRMLLVESCRDVSTGTMPGAYTLLHPEMRLSTQDIATICAARIP